MLSCCGFNGFKQIYSLSKVVFTESQDEINLKNSIGYLTSPRKVFTVYDMDIQFTVSKANIAFSRCYCAIFNKNILWLCGFIKKKDTLFQRVQSPNNFNIHQFSCNRHQVICVTEEGGCWQYSLEAGEWRDLKNILHIDKSLEDNEFVRVKKVCCGETLTTVLTDRGVVYNMPNKLNIPDVRVVDVACGRSHILMLSDKGEVYSVGEGSRGQLGHGELENEEDPQLVEALAGLNIVAIACGGWHSCAVSAGGDLYSWGWNVAGQLGLHSIGDLGSVQAVPHFVDWPYGDVQVIKVDCGSRHTLALLDDGSVWGCGWNAYGQLALPGVDSTNCMTRLPTAAVKDIICGSWNSGLIT